MSKKSKISFEDIPDIPELENVFRAVDRTLKKFEVDYFVIGAFAKDIWIAYLNSPISSRKTKDIDFAARIKDKDQFIAIKSHFIQEEGFHPYSENHFILISPDGIQIDLLPFGEIEDDQKLVAFHGVGKTDIFTQGFKEVFTNSQGIEISGNTYQVSSLPGLVILKLIAWQDRPEHRVKDLHDIFQILINFEDLTQEDFFEHHLDLFEAYDSEKMLYLKRIAARVLGRQMGLILQKSAPLRDRIIDLLSQATEDNQSSLVKKMGEGKEVFTLTDIQNLITDLLEGAKERS